VTLRPTFELRRPTGQVVACGGTRAKIPPTPKNTRQRKPGGERGKDPDAAQGAHPCVDGIRRGDRHLTTRLSELTPTPISSWSLGEPGFAVVRAGDPDLYQCPFLFASDVGQLGFSEVEAAAMRDYLLKGGFFWADDFWGTPSWNHFVAELRKVLPEYDIIDLPLDHPLFSIVYEVPTIPQIPNLGFWRRSGGQTSELGFDSLVPSMRAILDERGRILVLMTHNTDIADGWEREPDDDAYFALFSPDAYAIGLNVVMWVMTH